MTRTWTTSTYSQTDWQQQCVEVGRAAAAPTIALRDSVHPDHATLELGRAEWATLLGALRRDTLA